MTSFFLRWVITTFAVAAAVKLTGMHAEGWGPLICMALVLGIINAFIRPILLFLSIPFILVTLGFFILIVNALLFWFAGGLVPGFHVGGFWNAFFGSLIVSVVNWALSIFFRSSDGEYHLVTRRGILAEGAEKPVQGRIIE